MRHSAFRTLALSTAFGALALGATVLAPTSAAAAPMVDRAAINAALGGTIDHTQPVEMQRRGGFRGGGGGFRGGPRGGFRGGRGGRGIGPGAAIGLGAAALIIGGAAAAAASAGPRECWIERRWVEGPYGPERRRIRVCE